MIKGIDISQWQGSVSFTKVKTAVDFCIIKTTEGYGKPWIDPKFIENQRAARLAGLLIGYYCYTRPDLGNTVEQEVDFLLDTIGELKEGEVIFLDYEVSYAYPVAWCKAWLEYLQKKLNGYKGLVYLNQSLLNSNDWQGVISGGFGLWLAVYDYMPNNDMPQTKWGVCAFKQYSNKETVPGISGVVDGNVFYGDVTQYKKYGYVKNTSTTPPVTPPPSSEEIIEKLEKEIDSLSDQLIEEKQQYTKLNTNYEEYKENTTKELASKKEQIESIQKTNSELSLQITVMSGQVKVALEEKDKALAVVQPLTDANKKLSEDKEELKKKINTLNAQLVKNLQGYGKWTRFKSIFGFY